MEKSSVLHLQGGIVSYLVEPYPQLSFTNSKSEPPTVLTERAYCNLMRCLPTVGRRVKKMTEAIETDGCEDQTFYVANIFERYSKSVRIEAWVYNKKVYIFIKSYFKSNRPYLANVNSNEKIDVDPEVEDEQLKRFEQVIKQKSGTSQWITNWMPTKGIFRIQTEEIVHLQKFVIDNLCWLVVWTNLIKFNFHFSLLLLSKPVWVWLQGCWCLSHTRNANKSIEREFWNNK